MEFLLRWCQIMAHSSVQNTSRNSIKSGVSLTQPPVPDINKPMGKLKGQWGLGRIFLAKQQIHTLLLCSIGQNHKPMDTVLQNCWWAESFALQSRSYQQCWTNAGWTWIVWKKKKKLGKRNKENNSIKDTEHMIYHSYIQESLCGSVTLEKKGLKWT